MAKEQVNIVFSADSAQARKLFEEISNGLDKVGKKVQNQSKQMEGFGGSFARVAAGYAGVTKLSGYFTQALANETKALHDRADAWEKYQGGMDKIRGEGGLSAGMAESFRGAVAGATQFAAVDTATAQSVAQQMLEDKFAPDSITGGGLNAMLKGIVAINARGEGGDPKNLSKSIANVMQTLGRSPTQGGVESTIADLHGLMNATGMDLGGAEGLLSSMARINTPKKAKILAQRGLTPGQIDVNALGIGPAGKNLAAALEGMTESDQAAYLSRLIGDEGATAFMRGKSEFASGRVSSAMGDVERDFSSLSSGPMADLRRNRAAREQALGRNGELDAQFRDALQSRDQEYSQGNILQRGINLMRPAADPILTAIFGDQFKKDTIKDAERYHNSIRVEIVNPNGGRADGRVRSDKNLQGLNN